MAAKGPRLSGSCEDLEDGQLFCRERGHWWDHVNDRILIGTRATPRRIERESECSHCLSGMLEVFDLPSFELVRRRYTYADGYLLAGNSGPSRYHRADFRRERGYRDRLLTRRQAAAG